MSDPRRMLAWMALFLAAVAGLCVLRFEPLRQAFYANPVFNGMILAVLFVGVLITFAQVLAVGDSFTDAEAARAAGMPVYLVPYGYNEGRSVHAADVDGIVSSLSELSSLLQGQNARVS